MFERVHSVHVSVAFHAIFMLHIKRKYIFSIHGTISVIIIFLYSLIAYRVRHVGYWHNHSERIDKIFHMLRLEQ